MKIDYLPINKSKTRMDKFIIEMDGSEYLFEVYWNPIGEYFVFNMYDREKSPIILGRKIIHDVNMLDNIIDDRLPNVVILPVNPAVEEGQITYNNFMDDVKCYILPGDVS